MSRILSLSRALLFAIAAAGCGGGGGSDDGGVDALPPLGPNEARPTASQPVVVIGAVALDFTMLAGFENDTVSATREADVGAQAMAADLIAAGRAKATSLPPLTVGLPRPPLNRALEVRVSGVPSVAIGASDVLVAHYLVVGNGTDGGSVLTEVVTTFDRDMGTASFSLPAFAFYRVGSEERHLARVVLLAKAGQPVIAASASGAALPSEKSSAATGTLDCPIETGCIETSMFSETRLTSAQWNACKASGLSDGACAGRARPHLGADFAAPGGTQVFAPPGSLLVAGRSPDELRELNARYLDEECASDPNRSAACIELHRLREAGAYLTLLHPSDVLVTYAHLGAIGDWALRTVNGRRVVAVPSLSPVTVPSLADQRAGAFVARTGNTPCPEVGPGCPARTALHLHVEVRRAAQPSCTRQDGLAGFCTKTYVPVDPLEAMVARRDVTLLDGNVVPPNALGRALFRTSDSGALLGRPSRVSSAVADPLDRLPGDPERALCIWDDDSTLRSDAGGLQFTAYRRTLPGSDAFPIERIVQPGARGSNTAYSCVPWQVRDSTEAVFGFRSPQLRIAPIRIGFPSGPYGLTSATIEVRLPGIDGAGRSAGFSVNFADAPARLPDPLVGSSHLPLAQVSSHVVVYENRLEGRRAPGCTWRESFDGTFIRTSATCGGFPSPGNDAQSAPVSSAYQYIAEDIDNPERIQLSTLSGRPRLTVGSAAGWRAFGWGPTAVLSGSLVMSDAVSRARGWMRLAATVSHTCSLSADQRRFDGRVVERDGEFEIQSSIRPTVVLPTLGAMLRPALAETYVPPGADVAAELADGSFSFMFLPGSSPDVRTLAVVFNGKGTDDAGTRLWDVTIIAPLADPPGAFLSCSSSRSALFLR
jgi:murein DD-endopeptidase MepM/ murein hydrolase activator NlpD